MATELYGRTVVKEALPADVRQARREAREARHAEAVRIAKEAADRRASGVNTQTTIEQAKKRLNGTNVAGAIQVIQSVPFAVRDLYILTEEYGQGRKSVLRAFGTPRASQRETYLQAVGVGSPDESPETGTTEE